MNVAASTIMAQGQLKQQAGIMLAKQVMDTTQAQSNNLLKMMQSSKIEQKVTPHLGGSVDIRI